MQATIASVLAGKAAAKQLRELLEELDDAD